MKEKIIRIVRSINEDTPYTSEETTEQILEEIRKSLPEKRKEAESIDVGPINIPDVETQGYNQALEDIIKLLN